MNHCDILWVDDFDKISSDKQGVIDGKVVAFDIDDEEEDEDSSNTPDTNDYSKQKDNFGRTAVAPDGSTET